MVTDEDIIAKAVWKLDRSPGEVTRVFHAWVETVLTDVRNGARAEIPGLGVLTMNNGRANFTAADGESGDTT